jgi:vancomycin resistance protein VanW
MGRSKSAWEVVDYRVRRLGLQAARIASWWLFPRRWPRPERYSTARHPRLEIVAHELRVPIARADRFADPSLEAGKRRNLQIAAPAFDGVVIGPDRPLSFWRTLGRADQSRGFTWGADLRQGCVVPAIAGGLCLLSNSLFELAARAGWTILERHGHSLEAIPPLPGTLPLDATVAWPDVDLVFAPSSPARLSVRVDGDFLRVAALMASAPSERVELTADERVEWRGADKIRASRVLRRRVDESGTILAIDEVARSEKRIVEAGELGRSCLTCGETECRDRPSEPTLVAIRSAVRRG